MLRWGLLGDGAVAAAAASGVRATGGDLAVVATPTLTRAQAFASQQGVRRARSDYAEVVSAPDVDAVVVELPPLEREQWVDRALSAGKHVLCAPPLAIDAAGAGRMAAAAVSARRLLVEAVPMRFHPRTEALLDLVHGGSIGVVRLCDASLAVDGGGDPLDLAHPALACVRWLLGEQPADVRATRLNGALGIVLSFPGGAVSVVGATTGAAPTEALRVVGAAGTVVVPHPFGATRAHDAALERNGEVIGSWRADPVQLMVQAFGEAAAGGRVALPTDDAVATAAVRDAVTRALG